MATQHTGGGAYIAIGQGHHLELRSLEVLKVGAARGHHSPRQAPIIKVEFRHCAAIYRDKFILCSYLFIIIDLCNQENTALTKKGRL